ncbi:hypothetical protein CCP4SC76_920001 [Gammaproteobacteria bacterium]
MGTVTSSPAGIDCGNGSSCTASFASGTSVALTAAPGSGYSFGGWGGSCSGTGTCTVKLTANSSVTATFNAIATSTVGGNYAPVIQAPPPVTIQNGAPQALNFVATDKDNDTLTYRVVTQPKHGTLTGTFPSLIYTPVASSGNFPGVRVDGTCSDQVCVEARDGKNPSNTACTNIDATSCGEVACDYLPGRCHSPFADSQYSLSTDAGVPLAITLSAADEDYGDNLSYNIRLSPAHGTLTGYGQNLTYYPNAGFGGSDSFSFVADDGYHFSSEASVVINVKGAVPVTVKHRLTVTRNGQGSIQSSPEGIACGTTCAGDFSNVTTVTLTATPASGQTFTGWSGACSGTGSCSLKMGADQSVTATFSAGIDDVSVVVLITHYYESILGRAPESAGLGYYQGRIDQAKADGQDVKPVFKIMAYNFFNSPEYLNRGTSNAEYVTTLYKTFLQRDPESAGLAFYLDILARGGSRNSLLDNFVNSPEFAQFMANLGL